MDITINPSLDCKTMIAILNANPDGVAIIGAWNSMETMAREDPEGCVRLSPGLPMDNTALAALLRCTEAVVEKTVEVFGKLNRITVKNGLIKVLGCGEVTPAVPEPLLTVNAETKQDASEEALAIKREKNRIRKAKSRARQKQAQMAETEKQPAAKTNVTTVTAFDKRDQCDNGCDRRDSRCDQCDTACDTAPESPTVIALPAACDSRDRKRDVPGAGTALYNRISNSNIYPLHASHAHKPVSKYLDLHKLVPLNELPPDYRDVIHVWNGLPLPKFKGLVPELLENLKYLLQRYGKNTLCKTIAGIANNAFLLGKKEGTPSGKPWTVSLGWLLEPANFAKVLSGKYRDEKNGNTNCINLHSGERLPFFLPGEGPEGFTPEERDQAIRDLFIPTTPAQLKAARLVLPGYKEVTA